MIFWATLKTLMMESGSKRKLISIVVDISLIDLFKLNCKAIWKICNSFLASYCIIMMDDALGAIWICTLIFGEKN